ncbi:MAG: hypothetical protein J6C96_09180, partial [Oscillospiraceae bacterium]|nr:hypothetical protein [Oscillospiraceae bacterium]
MYGISEARVKSSPAFQGCEVLRGRAPKSRSAERETPQLAPAGARKNGARGEKCDSILRGGEQDRLPLLELQIKLFFKTVRWTVLNEAKFC